MGFLGHPNLEMVRFVVLDYSMLVFVLAVAEVDPILEAESSGFLPDYHRYRLAFALFHQY